MMAAGLPLTALGLVYATLLQNPQSIRQALRLNGSVRQTRRQVPEKNIIKFVVGERQWKFRNIMLYKSKVDARHGSMDRDNVHTHKFDIGETSCCELIVHRSYPTASPASQV